MKLLKVHEVAEFLRVDEETVRRYLRAGKFPSAWRVGRHWRIPAAAVMAFNEIEPQGPSHHTLPDSHRER